MTSFSATYRRLSQYLKEQQRLVATVARPSTTMSLLPGFDVPSETEADTSDQQPMDLFPQHAGLGLGLAAREEEKSQLTIFYGGQILVSDDFPADKAKNLMLVAGKSKSVNPPTVVGVAEAVSFSRRASLRRFIEKRRVRIHSSKSPYRKDGSPEAWVNGKGFRVKLFRFEILKLSHVRGGRLHLSPHEYGIRKGP